MALLNLLTVTMACSLGAPAKYFKYVKIFDEGNFIKLFCQHRQIADAFMLKSNHSDRWNNSILYSQL